MNLEAIQNELQKANIDGWLFYDFRGRDTIATRILGIDPNHFSTRRWFYYIPAKGEPRKLANAIEPAYLDFLPGSKEIYMPWKELPGKLSQLLEGAKTVAMQWSPNCSIPYISVVDGGMVDLIRSIGVEVVSSGNLVSIFEAHLDEAGWQSHYDAGQLMMKIKDMAFAEIGNRIKAGNPPTEYEIHMFMRDLYEQNGLEADHGPIVGVNEHAADPHFDNAPDNSFTMKEGDLVLIDLFAKEKKDPNSVWYDITWMGFIGDTIPARIQEVWEIAKNARNSALKLVQERFASNTPLQGGEVDDAARNVINSAGLGKYFIHRTGHNISATLHGNGAHCDNFETNDTRLIIKGSCFSIEPGIYIAEEKIGFRTEIDVFIKEDGEVVVVGEIQDEIIKIQYK
jgi:Xaa-Pro dipeptidase